MRKRKINEKIVNELKSLQSTRESFNEFLHNYLTNSSRYVIYIHDILATKPKREQLHVPVSQYIVSLVTCWETFFRDLFVFITNIDDDFLKDVIKMNNINIEEDEINKYKLTAGEFISKFYNFQNLQDTENAFSPLWDDKIFFEELGKYETQFVLFSKGVIADISLNKFDKDWYVLVSELFEMRHNIIHDANYRFKLEEKFISRAESVFILLPQIIGQYVGEIYEIDRPIFDAESVTIRNSSSKKSKEIGYIFTVNDMISKDWVVAATE